MRMNWFREVCKTKLLHAIRHCYRLSSRGKRVLTKSQRFDELELLRGLAALGVVVYHFLRAFVAPERTSDFAQAVGLAIERPFVLSPINGPFMVSIFFVLYSFALTVKLLGAPAPVPVGIAVAKRFPRLFPVTFIGVMLPAALYVAGLMFNEPVAALSGSEWLRDSGGVKVDGPWPAPSLSGGVADSVRLFGRGLSQYNSALWTMRYELLGSIAALGTALLIAGRRRPLLDTVIVTVVGLLALEVHALCALCVTTVLITKYLRDSSWSLSPVAASAMIAVGLLIGSTYKPFPEELALDPVLGEHILRLDWVIHGAGATMVFLGVHRWRRRQMADWPFARMLGRLSFAVYAIHIPVIASLGAGIVLALGYGLGSVLLAALASAVVIGIVAHGIAYFDQWWVMTINRTARVLASIRKRDADTAVPSASDAP